MDKPAVYKKMTASPTDLFDVMEREIRVKSDCVPFAVKAIDALNSLGKITEKESIKAAYVFLDNLQTLNQGGITPKDHDKIDFVKRGKVITISARVEAFYRAANRKGYSIIDTIVAVPKEDADTTYFKENFYNGEIVYTLEDKRIQPDRAVTAERLIAGYFCKFICRLEVKDAKQHRRILMTVCEMSNEEVLNAANASDNGLYKIKKESYYNDYREKKWRRVVTDELNKGSIWWTWTSEMVAKTIIRRALKRVREVLPELKETIFAFEKDAEPPEALPEPEVIDIPVENDDVDINKLTETQTEEVQEMLALFVANPKLADDKADEIMRMFNGKNAQEVINVHYASIANIRRSERLRPIIAPLFEAAANA